eukprot:scaffold79959_cov23-Tisochrysis_lutea.AAC.1
MKHIKHTFTATHHDDIIGELRACIGHGRRYRLRGLADLHAKLKHPAQVGSVLALGGQLLLGEEVQELGALQWRRNEAALSFGE